MVSKWNKKKSFYDEQVIIIRASRLEELWDFRVSPCPIKVSFFLKKIKNLRESSKREKETKVNR